MCCEQKNISPDTVTSFLAQQIDAEAAYNPPDENAFSSIKPGFILVLQSAVVSEAFHSVECVSKIVREAAGCVGSAVQFMSSFLLKDSTAAVYIQSDELNSAGGSRMRNFLHSLEELPALKKRQCKVGCSSTFQEVREAVFYYAQATESVGERHMSKTVSNVLEYISINYTDPDLSGKTIANDFFLNYTYLSQLFHQETGKSISTHITEFRMKTAYGLLTLPNRNLVEVARAVGYLDTKSFSAHFKRYYGCTPKQYRRMQMRQL